MRAFAAPAAPRARWVTTRSVDGTPITWRADGPSRRGGALRTPVVLCNGIACSDAYWRDLLPALARQRTVVRWDYRGHGRSGPPAVTGAVDVGAVVDDLRVVLDAAGVGRAVLIGHSYGVQVAIEGAALLTDRVAGVVAVAGAPGRPVHLPLGADPRRTVFPLLDLLAERGGSHAAGAWERLWTSKAVYWVARALRGTNAQAPREVMETYFDHVSGLDPQLLLTMFRSMQEHDATELLADLEVPVLAIAGDADGFTPLERMAEIALAARGELAVVPGGSHTLPIEQPDAVLAHVEPFLERLDGVPG